LPLTVLFAKRRGLKGRRRRKKRRSDRNSDARRRRSHRSNSGRGVGCEEKEKPWTVVWGSTPQEGQRGLGIISILSLQEWRELQKD